MPPEKCVYDDKIKSFAASEGLTLGHPFKICMMYNTKGQHNDVTNTNLSVFMPLVTCYLSSKGSSKVTVGVLNDKLHVHYHNTIAG